jgi:hypothetical protein
MSKLSDNMTLQCLHVGAQQLLVYSRPEAVLAGEIVDREIEVTLSA